MLKGNHNLKIIREVKTDWIRIYLREDNIVVTEEVEGYPQESNAEIAKTIVAAVDEVCQDEVYPMMSFFGNRKLSREERSYYMSHQNHNISKVAIVVNNPFQAMLANFFVGINKVPVVRKVFSNESQALDWLTASE